MARFTKLFVLILSLSLLTVTSVTAAEQQPQLNMVFETVPGTPPIPEDLIASLSAAPNDIITKSLSAATIGSSIDVGNGITITLLDDVPNDVISVVAYSLLEWDSKLNRHDVPLEVELLYRPLSAGVLGSAGPYTVTQSGVSTPTALYNANLGYDVYPNFADIRVTLSSSFSWDTTINGTSPVAPNYSMQTVVLHELGHGFGFISSFDYDDDGTQTPSSFDNILYYDQTTPMISNTGTTGNQLSNDVWSLNADLTWERVFAPSVWDVGSSMSHLNENSYLTGTAGSLMTPFFSQSENIHTVDFVAIGIMNEIGYDINIAPNIPTVQTVQYDNNSEELLISMVPNISTTAPPASEFHIEFWDTLNESSREHHVLSAGEWSDESISGALAEGLWDIIIYSSGVNGTNPSSEILYSFPVGILHSYPAAPVITSYSGNELSAELAWDTPYSGTSSITGYTLKFTSSEPNIYVYTTSNSVSAVLPVGIYQAYVLAANTSEVGLWSSPVSVTVWNTPAKPTNLVATSVSDSNTIDAAWTDLNDGSFNVVDYTLQWDTDSGFANPQATNTTGDAVIQNVANGTWYLRVRANSIQASSEWSSAATVTVESSVTHPIGWRPDLSDQVLRLYSAYFLRQPDNSGLTYWTRTMSEGTTLQSVSDFFSQSPEFITKYGSLNDSEFVNQLYLNVLGRQPDNEGRSYWVARLSSGEISRGGMMIGFSESPEFIAQTNTSTPLTANESRVWRLYVTILGREADSVGLAYWTSQQEILGSDAVASLMLTSPEFTAKYGSLDDTQFVTQLYLNVLGRNGESDGISYWVSQLSQGATRADVIQLFSNSSEFIVRTNTLK